MESSEILARRARVTSANRVAVVTGAGSGIGAACARQVALRGATVVTADIDLEAVRSFAIARVLPGRSPVMLDGTACFPRAGRSVAAGES